MQYSANKEAACDKSPQTRNQAIGVSVADSIKGCQGQGEPDEQAKTKKQGGSLAAQSILDCPPEPAEKESSNQKTGGRRKAKNVYCRAVHVH
jgi:hypothetical protein